MIHFIHDITIATKQLTDYMQLILMIFQRVKHIIYKRFISFMNLNLRNAKILGSKKLSLKQMRRFEMSVTDVDHTLDIDLLFKLHSKVNQFLTIYMESWNPHE